MRDFNGKMDRLGMRLVGKVRGSGGGGGIKGGNNMVADWGLANSWRKVRVAN